MIIRDETPDDREAIRRVIDAAFLNHPHSQQREGQLVEALRGAGALTLSLVAEDAGHVVGHIAFSPVAISGVDPGWYGLAPVAVQPDRQGSGIGRTLIETGLARLEALGAAGCVLVGEPELYGRFGFNAEPRLTYPGLPAEYFLARPFAPHDGATASLPEGIVAFHAAFDAV
jgi:putative acetyltransferase